MKKLLLVVISLYSLDSVSQVTPIPLPPPGTPCIGGFGFVFEQDAVLEWIQLGALNQDRNYTQGLGVYFLLDRLSYRFDSRLRLNTSNLIYRMPVRASIQLAGFTPDDLRQKDPVEGDRPYSSVLFLSLTDQRIDQLNYRSRSWSGYLGLLGIPNAAKKVQTAIHKGMNDGNTKPPYNPEGWHNQISHGGEPTLLLGYEEKRLLTTSAINTQASTNTLNNSFEVGI